MKTFWSRSEHRSETVADAELVTRMHVGNAVQRAPVRVRQEAVLQAGLARPLVPAQRHGLRGNEAPGNDAPPAVMEVPNGNRRCRCRLLQERLGGIAAIRHDVASGEPSAHASLQHDDRVAAARTLLQKPTGVLLETETVFVTDLGKVQTAHYL